MARHQPLAGGGPTSVALTFDDGPDPVDTPKLLDLLREKGVKATFFVVGKRADQYPEIVRRAWTEGHLIANHTWSHRNLFCFLTPSRLRTEIERGTESVRRICGSRPRLFRSPVGLRHALLRPYLNDAGLEYVSWTIRTRDTLTSNSGVLARRILSQATGGDIILLHDRLPRGAHVLLEALPGVIDDLRARGFEFVLAGPREDGGAATPELLASDSAALNQRANPRTETKVKKARLAPPTGSSRTLRCSSMVATGCP